MAHILENTAGSLSTVECVVDIAALFKAAADLRQRHQHDQAADCYRCIIQAAPALPEAHFHLGLIWEQQGSWDEAVECLSRAFELSPGWTEAGLALAAAHHRLGRIDNATSIYQMILHKQPDCVQAASLLGLLYIETGRNREAIPFLERVIFAYPHNFMALNNLGLALHRSGRMEDAIGMFRRAIDARPDYLKAYHNLGNVYRDLDNARATIECYRAALNLIPTDARAQHMMGHLYLEHHDPSNARLHFQKAVDLNPQFADAWMSLATTALILGDYNFGWSLYHWRFKTAEHQTRIYPFRHSWPMWRGEPFEGRRLLVHCEQGLGDSIQFSRFLPHVKRLGGELIFQVQPSLMPLFEGSPHIDGLLPLTDVFPRNIDIDLYMPLLSLPACLGLDESSIRMDQPYLSADHCCIEKWKRRFSKDHFNIGVVWSGNPLFIHNTRRSCDPHGFIPVGRLDGVRLFTLQKGGDPADLQALTLECGAEHLGDGFSSFGDTAAAIECLDLVITVCTSVAHMAGAMGKPVWLLLNYLPDWRWGLQGSTTPWYPSMRLFRQEKAGCWEPVFASLIDALESEIAICRGGRGHCCNA